MNLMYPIPNDPSTVSGFETSLDYTYNRGKAGTKEWMEK